VKNSGEQHDKDSRESGGMSGMVKTKQAKSKKK
jgi:hypothetical protein